MTHAECTCKARCLNWQGQARCSCSFLNEWATADVMHRAGISVKYILMQTHTPEKADHLTVNSVNKDGACLEAGMSQSTPLSCYPLIYINWYIHICTHACTHMHTFVSLQRHIENWLRVLPRKKTD